MDADADLERRFGGLRRLYGDAPYTRLRALRVGVVGLGGVGSWAVEALARSGVAALTLFDMDHVAESNINRQIQALTSTLGQSKALALQTRITDIHPDCAVTVIDDFVTPENWPLPGVETLDVLIDACDDMRAKTAMADWALQHKKHLIVVGAAGGKYQPQRTEISDLLHVTHDPLLAKLRRHLRQNQRLQAGLICVFSREPVQVPDADANAKTDTNATLPMATTDGSLNCHGYGSSVAVTGAFGFAAAAAAVECCRILP